MIIRPAQIQQLSAARQRGFEDFVIAMLREEFAERCVLTSDDAMRAGVRQSSDRCRAYGITDQNSIAKFVYLTWLLGQGFEETPDNVWLGTLIRDRRRPAGDRMAIAMSGVIHHLERETGAIQFED